MGEITTPYSGPKRLLRWQFDRGGGTGLAQRGAALASLPAQAQAQAQAQGCEGSQQDGSRQLLFLRTELAGGQIPSAVCFVFPPAEWEQPVPVALVARLLPRLPQLRYGGACLGCSGARRSETRRSAWAGGFKFVTVSVTVTSVLLVYVSALIFKGKRPIM